MQALPLGGGAAGGFGGLGGFGGRGSAGSASNSGSTGNADLSTQARAINTENLAGRLGPLMVTCGERNPRSPVVSLV